MLESIESKILCQHPIRFVGGGALSSVTAQIFADVTGRELEVPEMPHNAGTMGAALIAARGLGWISSYQEIGKKITIKNYFRPGDDNISIYEKHYQVFRSLYKKNKSLFKQINTGN